MIRRAVCILLLFSFVAACGASAREKTIRTTFVAARTLQAGFEAWDKEHQLEIARTAPTQLIGLAELTTYKQKRAPVLASFEIVYRTLAAAAIVNDDHHSLTAAVAAFEQLERAVQTLTGGKLP